MNRKSTFLLTVFLCGLAAAVALVPLIFGGYPAGHSVTFNVPWTAGFLAQLFEGDLYPRWLHSYPAGIGSPVFYFYAPLPFYLTGTGYLFCQNCSITEVLSIAHWEALFLSGLAFYFWARSFTGYTPALFCSIIYIFMPYHLTGLFIRATVGETMTYVFVPLILLHMKKLLDSDRSLVWTSVFYASLILSHLPSAFLFSFIPHDNLG